MGQITIRNLNDAVIAALRQKAAASGHSMEEEARRVLSASVGMDKAQWLARLDAVRATMPVEAGGSAEAEIRAMRDSRASG